MPRFAVTREPVARFGKIGSYIDKGGHATVYQTTRGYAAKMVSKKGESEALLKEICTLRNLNHPNIIKLLGLYCGPKRYIYMELGKTTLYTYICMENYPKKPQWYVYQLLRALEYCHANNIIHRDVKPQNVLICKDEQVRLIDFGLAKCAGESGVTHTGEVFTLWWRPPEVLLGKRNYGCEVDMWPVGLILLEILTGLMPKGDTEIDQLYQIFRLTGTPSKTDWPESRELPYWSSIPVYKRSLIKTDIVGLQLVYKLLEWPHKRISATRALAHPYFNKVRGEAEGRFPFTAKSRECRRPNRSGFNKDNRYKVLEWLWLLKKEYQYSYSTLFTSYAIFDKYIELVETIDKTDIQGLAAMSLLIATKLLEVAYSDPEDYVTICDHTYTKAQLKEYETHILQIIDYQVDLPYTSLLKETNGPTMLYFVAMYFNYNWVADWSPNKFVEIFCNYVSGQLSKQLSSKLKDYFESLTGEIAKELHKNLLRL